MKHILYALNGTFLMLLVPALFVLAFALYIMFTIKYANKVKKNAKESILPEKTEEIQGCIVSEISEYTGLHVAAVHVIVKGLTQPKDRTESEEEIEEFCAADLPSTEDFLEEIKEIDN